MCSRSLPLGTCLLVAPMTITWPLSCRPSISASMVDTTEAKIWSLSDREARAGTRPSSSSKKMMDGACASACHSTGQLAVASIS